MRYLIVAKNPSLTERDGADAESLRERVAELSGSDVMGYPSVRRKLREGGLVYVATRSTGDRERFDSGFFVIDTENPHGLAQAALLGVPA